MNEIEAKFSISYQPVLRWTPVINISWGDERMRGMIALQSPEAVWRRLSPTGKTSSEFALPLSVVPPGSTSFSVDGQTSNHFSP